MKEAGMQPAYRRVLLKLSGEALSAGADGVLNHEFIEQIAAVLKKCLDKGVEIGVIVGAGNIWRGRQGKDMDPALADHMGMLATAINALALQDAFCHAGLDARAMMAVRMEAFAEPYTAFAVSLSISSTPENSCAISSAIILFDTKSPTAA